MKIQLISNESITFRKITYNTRVLTHLTFIFKNFWVSYIIWSYSSFFMCETPGTSYFFTKNIRFTPSAFIILPINIRSKSSSKPLWTFYCKWIVNYESQLDITCGFTTYWPWLAQSLSSKRLRSDSKSLVRDATADAGLGNGSAKSCSRAKPDIPENRVGFERKCEFGLSILILLQLERG